MADNGPKPARCGDVSTWKNNRRSINLVELLQSLDENAGPEGLDLHGANLSRLDLSIDAINGLASALQFSPFLRSWVMDQRVDLHGAHLEKAFVTASKLPGANLTRVHLEGARLAGTHLLGADLSHAHLQGADLESANLDEALLYGSQLHGANLTKASLCGARMSDADLQNAILALADLRGLRIGQCNLEGATLIYAHLEHVDLSLSNRLLKVRWFGAFLQDTRMRRDQLGSAIGDEENAKLERTAKTYLPASEAYLVLKNNFINIGRYGDAAWAYVKERQMHKMACYWAWRPQAWPLWQRYDDDNPSGWHGHRVWKFFLEWLRNWGYEALAGYGERPWRPVGWAVGLAVGVFPFLYMLAGLMRDNHETRRWLDAATYSVTTFGTLSFSDLQPTTTIAHIISATEAFTGVLLFALFVFTLGNRMSRS